LIINCSPALYNEAETLSTLRFGIRAKSIKNKARVNAELSPAELKALLKKAQRDVAAYQSYVAQLEAELGTWRSGGQVDKGSWTSLDRAAAGLGDVASSTTSTPATPAPKRDVRSSSPVPGSRPYTPASALNPALERLAGDYESRPQTPSIASLDKDEREEFLKRENELSDQLAEKESLVNNLERMLKEVRDEVEFFKEQEGTTSAVSFHTPPVGLHDRDDE
jgi:kinesin family protein 5